MSPRPCPPGPQLPADDLAAISDLSELAAELSARGFTTRLSAPPRPCLTIGHPCTEPQRISAEGEFFCWHRPNGHVPFSPRRIHPALTAHGVVILIAWIILDRQHHPAP
jgi:hypothetical protein